eukprot:3947091-Pyramimonas_sp.AAC.1
MLCGGLRPRGHSSAAWNRSIQGLSRALPVIRRPFGSHRRGRCPPIPKALPRSPVLPIWKRR